MRAAMKNVQMADENEEKDEKGPNDSLEDSFAQAPDAGRLRKLNSNLGITTSHVGHMQTEASLDNSEENKKRGSLFSNISNFSSRGGVGAALFWVKLNVLQPDLQKADIDTSNVRQKMVKDRMDLCFSMVRWRDYRGNHTCCGPI